MAPLFSLIYRLGLRVLNLFDAENVHHHFVNLLKILGRSARSPSIKTCAQNILGQSGHHQSPKITAFGLQFTHRVGLAAGLDKNAEALEGLQLLDFAFIEVGTVTPQPQNGNPRPRLFRDYSQELIFNAMGFNNGGVSAMRTHLEKAAPFLRNDLVVGINIGKNASTSLEDAWRDYVFCARELKDHGHYMTINVSSPNTQGLRGLQNFSALAPILEAVINETQKSSRSKPILVKLAPEMDAEFMAKLICDVEAKFPIAGWILTNTLQRPTPFEKSAMSSGGLSGAPLKAAALAALKVAKEHSTKDLVSSGGILSVADAQERVQHGATLVQVYSALIFKGPQIVSDMAQQLKD